jgi:hypothetical protein
VARPISDDAAFHPTPDRRPSMHLVPRAPSGGSVSFPGVLRVVRGTGGRGKISLGGQAEALARLPLLAGAPPRQEPGSIASSTRRTSALVPQYRVVSWSSRDRSSMSAMAASRVRACRWWAGRLALSGDRCAWRRRDPRDSVGELVVVVMRGRRANPQGDRLRGGETCPSIV